jgi:calnexin
VVEAPLPALADPALKVPAKAQHYGIAAALPEPVSPASAPLVLQFDVKLSAGLTCGGAYLKFLTAGGAFAADGLTDATPYSVMFGPDKCGATNKVHLIVRHENQKSKAVEEKHLSFPPAVVDDAVSHVYTAILYPSNSSYAVLIDGEEKKAGSLFEDFEPAFVPAEKIDDPKDSKPASWVDEARIDDPKAKKPADWDEDAPEFVPDEEAEQPEGWLADEPAQIADPEAAQPADWDEEEDGEWEAPKVANPACAAAPGCGPWERPTKLNPDFKGKWAAPKVDNPAYKGVWKPRQVANPDFYNDTAPLSHIGSIGGVAVEIWTMDDGYFFDNVVVSNDPAEAAEIRARTWAPKAAIEKAEAEKKKAAEEAEWAAKSKASAGGKGVRAKVEGAVRAAVAAVFDFKPLAPLATKLGGARAALDAQPLAVAALAAAALAAAVAPVLGRALGAQAAAAKTGRAKKTDAKSADDKPAASAKKAAPKARAAAEEIEEEDEDEDASPTRAGARRRARRD